MAGQRRALTADEIDLTTPGSGRAGVATPERSQSGRGRGPDHRTAQGTAGDGNGGDSEGDLVQGQHDGAEAAAPVPCAPWLKPLEAYMRRIGGTCDTQRFG
jgi:hypothetical protein